MLSVRLMGHFAALVQKSLFAKKLSELQPSPQASSGGNQSQKDQKYIPIKVFYQHIKQTCFVKFITLLYYFINTLF